MVFEMNVRKHGNKDQKCKLYQRAQNGSKALLLALFMDLALIALALSENNK